MLLKLTLSIDEAESNLAYCIMLNQLITTRTLTCAGTSKTRFFTELLAHVVNNLIHHLCYSNALIFLGNVENTSRLEFKDDVSVAAMHAALCIRQ